jgi:phenylacetate-CoA ligase
MTTRIPQPGDLEPSRPPAATTAGLQLQRLKWSLPHAYDNVPHYRKPSTRPACIRTT